MSSSSPARPIRLYGTRLSGHCHRVEAFLSILNVPFEYIEIDMAAGANRKPEFLALNPFGEVPVIVDGDMVLADSNAILVYLARTYGEASWYPDNPEQMAIVQRWLSLAAGKIAYGPCAARLYTVFGIPQHYETTRAIARKLLDVLEPGFADRSFAAGEKPTIADIAAYAYIAHAPEGGVSLEAYPFIRKWLARIEALPRFVKMPVSNPAAMGA